MNFTKKQKISLLIIIIILISSLAVSIVFCCLKSAKSRRTFIFPSVEQGKCIIETRFLSKADLDPIEYYVSEILLGPITERSKRLFARDTKILSCYKRDKVLYINLSRDLLTPLHGSYPIKDGVELLKKNIKRNFSGISEIHVFVDGTLAFE